MEWNFELRFYAPELGHGWKPVLDYEKYRGHVSLHVIWLRLSLYIAIWPKR